LADDAASSLRCRCRRSVPLTVDVGAGCGLRQGEIFGLSPDDLDNVRPILHVRRQIKIVRGKLIFSAPKGGKVRDVPLPTSVAQRLAAHAEQYPPVEVSLPWGTSTGDPQTVRLYLTEPNGLPLQRPAFNTGVWKRAVRATGIEDHRRNGMHVLRHTYASVLLDAGESIKALSGYLGHTDPGFTLRVYTHLLPASEDRTRRAIDAAFADDPLYGTPTPDGTETA
jgi:integrase